MTNFSNDKPKQEALHATFTRLIEAGELSDCGMEVISATRDKQGRIIAWKSDYVVSPRYYSRMVVSRRAMASARRYSAVLVVGR